MNLDKYFLKKYCEQSYNCSHFLTEVWEEVTGQDISQILVGFYPPKGQRYAVPALRKSFTRLDEPVSPCVALFRRKGSSPHVGMFYKGRILHIRKSGAHCQPPQIAQLTFDRISYYAVKDTHDIP